jgi:flagellar protein FliO/FliZ
MQWLDQLPFADNRVIQTGFLAACGIAALIVLAILYRFAFAHRLRVPGGRTRQPRLGLVDAFSLDGQRQLVLVRRDNVEHLVMIGGPNDVLVESQINRALTQARDNNQASPLLAPGASARRTETPLAAAPVVAEAPPSKVAAPAAAPAAPAPAAPKAPPSAPAVAPKAPAPPPPAAAPPALARKAPAPVLAPSPPTKPIEPQAAPPPASAPARAAQSPEPVPPEPSSSPPPRPAPARPAMPPPIVPASGPVNRATVTRLTEKVPPRPSPVTGDALAPSAPAPAPPQPGKAEPAAAGAVKDPRARPPAATIAAATVPASPPARPAVKTPLADGAQKLGEVRAFGDKPNGASSVRATAKTDDPFADLDSLETEMARLLGREKLS